MLQTWDLSADYNLIWHDLRPVRLARSCRLVAGAALELWQRNGEEAPSLGGYWGTAVLTDHFGRLPAALREGPGPGFPEANDNRSTSGAGWCRCWRRSWGTCRRCRRGDPATGGDGAGGWHPLRSDDLFRQRLSRAGDGSPPGRSPLPGGDQQRDLVPERQRAPSDAGDDGFARFGDRSTSDSVHRGRLDRMGGWAGPYPGWAGLDPSATVRAEDLAGYDAPWSCGGTVAGMVACPMSLALPWFGHFHTARFGWIVG